MNNLYFLFGLFFIISCDFSSNPIKSSLNSDEFLSEILKNKEQYEIQVLFTEINRNKDGEPEFTDFQFQVDEEKYFYPASTIKLPIIVLTLNKINELRLEGIDINLKSKIKLKSYNKKQKIVINDSITSFQNLISKVFLTSDNSAANILIDFLGYNYFNSKMKKEGYANTYLNHKFSPDQNVNNNWEIQTLKDDIISSKDEQIFIKSNNISGLLKGDRTLKDGKVSIGPLDFSYKNRFSLLDMHTFIKKIIFTEKSNNQNYFNLNVEDYDFLRYWMSRFTYEDNGKKYEDDGIYYETYNKFFIHGMDSIAINKNIRVYNKLGEAYGTSTDTAYIKNYTDDIEFFLSATIYVNDNNVINDNIYEYDEIAIPFLAKLSQSIYNRFLD
ncbi:MAG: Uncharacterised protein [Flavobacteriales bacterium]|nr:MAG: Uncharacterised protein [Flavobacteriales bacterium]|tara:strand:+ start:909 stop:2063 length:1155 start_codon:yes stop_codon:yes gene_type:complete